MKYVYLDYAAATPLDTRVLKAMQPYFADKFYNPSAMYLASQDVAKDMTRARSRVATILGSKPAEIIFTAGGTEANNLAISGVMEQYPDANILTSAVEHDSVLLPARRYKTKEVMVKPNGQVDLDDLAKKIDDKTILVSIMYANNEIGTIQPIHKVANLIKQIRHERQQGKNRLPLYLHTDACQASNYLDLHVHRLGVDLMTLNGGKMYGPKQSGVLFKAARVELKPQIVGGGQEFGLRSGTENVANIIGFAEALEIAQESRAEEVERLQDLQETFFDLIEKQLPLASISGSREQRLPNNIHVQLPGRDNERLMMLLDELGVMCATGSACSASNEEVSHVLTALDLSEQEARSSLRFTMGRQTTLADIKYTVGMLRKAVD